MVYVGLMVCMTHVSRPTIGISYIYIFLIYLFVKQIYNKEKISM